MKLNILIGGKAGQGINKVSEIIAGILARDGYFVFNYRDYGSLIRGGNNFNIISISDKRIGSFESKLDGVLALDDKTLEKHKDKLKKDGFIVKFSELPDLGRNLNIGMAGCLAKLLGIKKESLLREVKEQLNFPDVLKAAEVGFDKQEKKIELKKINRKIQVMSGSQAIAQGFVDSSGEFYFAYPMTPATGVLHELGARQENHRVFQPENEIAVINMALGSSFAGKRVMVGTSGGGFDLMTEALSFSGMSEIPIVIYLASRPGPATGVPTYSSQADLNLALKAGHGEFPRVVIAPGDPIECMEKTNEAFYLAEKFKIPVILLSDKHLAESEFSFDNEPRKPLKIEINRKIPGESVARASGYEHDEDGHTNESAETAKKNAEFRLKKYEEIKQEVKKFEMFKIFGDKNAKNLVIGWGSTKGVILDALPENYRFLQVLYLKPLSEEIKKEIEKTQKQKGKIIIIEGNSTGQLGRLLREKTGIKIPDRILKYDTRPFTSDELKKQIHEIKW